MPVTSNTGRSRLVATLVAAATLAVASSGISAAVAATTPTGSTPGTSTPVAATTPTSPTAATTAGTTTATTPAPSNTPPPVAVTGANTNDLDAGLVPLTPTAKVSYAARLVVPVVVRSKPNRRSAKVTSLKPFGSWNGGPVVLSIAQVKMVGTVRWLKVLLPIRPNGSVGWLPQSSVEVMKLRYRILIIRKRHLLVVYKDGKRAAKTTVVVGAPGTPTPRGRFAVLEVVRQPKGEDIGPWALHLTAHSDVLENFGGGPGRVAIHGRAGDLLKDPLGTSRSHGCIRLSNAFVTYLHTVAKEGTPVEIV